MPKEGKCNKNSKQCKKDAKKGKKAKKEKDPNKPKKPMTAYFMYLADHREEIKAANPDAKVTEITKIASQQWKELDEETKNVYNAKVEAAKEEYKKQMEEYEANKDAHDDEEEEDEDDE